MGIVCRAVDTKLDHPDIAAIHEIDEADERVEEARQKIEKLEVT